MNMTELNYEKEERQLREQYERSGLEEDWEAWIQFIDRYVYQLKLARNHWNDAYLIIRNVELVSELPPVLRYRKAVLLNALSKNSLEAFDLFMSLIRDNSVENYIQARSSGYVLKYYTHLLRYNEVSLLFDLIQQSQDDKALQLLEDYDFSLMHEEQEDASKEEDTEVDPEEVLTFIHSEISGSREAKTKKQILKVYAEHRAENYDLYLDWGQGNWLAKGQAMDLSAGDIRVLFRMIIEGADNTSDMIYKARFQQELEPGNKKERGRLDSYYRRLKERLKLYGIITERYTVRPGTSYFVIYPEQMADEIFAD